MMDSFLSTFEDKLAGDSVLRFNLLKGAYGKRLTQEAIQNANPFRLLSHPPLTTTNSIYLSFASKAVT